MLNHAKLAATELSKLTPAKIETWRNALRDLPTRSGGRRGERRTDFALGGVASSAETAKDSTASPVQ